LQLSSGKPDLDVYKFVNLAEKEANEKGGFFSMEVDSENIFQRSLYISDIMLTYSKHFLDVVIIDSTYK